MKKDAKQIQRSLDECDLQTQLVHAGERLPVGQGQPVSTPVYTSTTFTYETMQEFDEVFGGERQGYFYTRNANPTTAAFESAMTLLEAGAGACAYASGMAALHAAVHVALKVEESTHYTDDARHVETSSRPRVILAAQDLYGVTNSLLHKVFGAYGVQVVDADFNDTEELIRLAQDIKPRVLVAETISNPLLKVCDIKAVAVAAREVGARLVIDNTFASPYLCQPLRFGADFAVHSATKYIGGHGDVTGGIVVARDADDTAALRQTAKLIGGILGAHQAHDLTRGLKTLGLRMERACANALRLARHLEGHTNVVRVYYPNATESDGCLRAGMRGALVSVEVGDNTRAAAFRFMENLRLCIRSTSLGDVFTGVLHPATSSHRDLSAEQRRALGITDGLVRISVGIEDAHDIIADIEQSLAA
jgi:cystathionine gamma-synthase/methionine-gamma-lyase